MDLSQEIGRALRHVRTTRGLTLRSAARASLGRFKPSSIAGYERGERAITLQRFCDLSEVYQVDAARLLSSILSRARGEPAVEVDLRGIERLEVPGAATLRDFAERIRSLRASRTETITLRTSDLEVIARVAGRDRDELIELLSSARRPS